MYLPTLLSLALTTTTTALSLDASKKPNQPIEASTGYLTHYHQAPDPSPGGNPYTPTPQTYSYGCYTEASHSKRALAGPSYTNYSSMTLDECEYYCTGYKFWGVEYGGECYCGNHLSQGSFPTFPTDCSITCPGDDYEKCGGSNRLSLYGTEPHPPKVNPNPHPAVYRYNYLGCWTEGNKRRALEGAAVTSSVFMTVERCANYCIDSGFTIFGLEYGSECYCGNDLARSSYVAYPPECDMSCSGKEGETCGGKDRLSLYHWV